MGGAYIHGLFMEGARWRTRAIDGEMLDDDEDSPNAYDIDGVKCDGRLMDSRLKELAPVMPVIYVKAVEVKPEWEPTSVGYLRHDPKVYECPVYITSFRGPTYVFLATLKTEEPTSKWTLAGVALVMQSEA